MILSYLDYIGKCNHVVLQRHSKMMKFRLEKYHGIVLESDIDIKENASHPTLQLTIPIQQLSWTVNFADKPQITASTGTMGKGSLAGVRRELSQLIVGEIVKSQNDKASEPTSI